MHVELRIHSILKLPVHFLAISKTKKQNGTGMSGITFLFVQFHVECSCECHWQNRSLLTITKLELNFYVYQQNIKMKSPRVFYPRLHANCIS